MFWGITPALDLLQEIRYFGKLEDEVNILIVGGSDARHVFKTVARKYRHKITKINFYLMDNAMEVTAKQLLLLNVALQRSEDLALVQKTRFFMELYGNAIIRPACAKYLSATAKQLVRMITNPDYMQEVMPYVHLDIKYKERDYLESLFKFWYAQVDFDIVDSWDRRMRKTLGVRYDTRTGVFDWDLHMRMHHIGGKQICNQEYLQFRKSGVAFSWLESEVSKTNRSMVCGIIPNGKDYAHHGYLGDMVTGPYVPYGLDCEDEGFLKATNGKCVNRATDVTERNLRQIFHEIEFQESYDHVQTNDLPLGTLITELSALRVVDVVGGDAGLKDRKCVGVENVTINFVSMKTLPLMKYKDKYLNFFDLLYFNSCYLKYMEKEVLERISKPGSPCLVENQLFVLSHRQKELEAYEQELMGRMEEVEHIKVDCDVQKDCYFKFILKP